MSFLSLSVCVWALVSVSVAMPTGPPAAACQNLTPQHNNSSPQTDSAPTSLLITGYSEGYEAGGNLTVTLSSDDVFRGFMIQARGSPAGEPLGMFVTTGSKIKTLLCTAESDTATHANPDPVLTITVQWSADTLPEDVEEITFHYTVVVSQDIYWVGETTAAIPVLPAMPPGSRIPLKEAGVADVLVRLHGALMSLAWGVLAPIGIMLALFYKIVWPDGKWFYAHIGIMIGTLLISMVGVIPIVVHADATWLATTTTNLPHQVLGIAALAAVAINPFLAICRCQPTSSWRWVYNTMHGSIGLLFGEGAAFGAMLLGLHIVRELEGVDMEYVHYAIYSMSGTIGFIIMMAALFNIYSINFVKRHPTVKEDLGVTSQAPSEFFKSQHYLDLEDEDEPRDRCCRFFLGSVILLILLIGGAANITLIALL